MTSDIHHQMLEVWARGLPWIQHPLDRPWHDVGVVGNVEGICCPKVPHLCSHDRPLEMWAKEDLPGDCADTYTVITLKRAVWEDSDTTRHTFFVGQCPKCESIYWMRQA